MNSGKSLRLIEKAKALRFGRKQVAMCNHTNDNRYGDESNVVSKCGVYCEARKIHNLGELTNEWLGGLTDLLIDEAHMFEDLLFHCQRICRMGINVHVFGLNLDLFRKPFASIQSIMPYCHKIYLLRAKCSFCGSDCIYSKLKYDSDMTKLINGNILIGGDSLWINACDNCFDKDYREFEVTNLQFVSEFRRERLRRAESSTDSGSPPNTPPDQIDT